MSFGDNFIENLRTIDQKFVKLPRFSTYIGRSISRLIAYKVRVLIQFMLMKLTYHLKMKPRLRMLNKLKNSQKNCEALLLASGRSVLKLDLEWVSNFQKNGGMVYTLNQYCDTPLSRNITPDVLVLSDPFYFSALESESKSRLFGYLNDHKDVVVAIPAHFDLPTSVDNNKIFFNALSLEGYSKNTSPLKPRGFVGLTAYHSLSLAQFLGHSKILLSGIDNDLFKGLERNKNGELVTSNRHAYSSESNYILKWDKSPQAVLEDLARCLGDLELFENHSTFNMNDESLFLTFPIYKQ